MPYIEMKAREPIASYAVKIAQNVKTIGELNYAISRICWEYLLKKGISYTNINEVIGVFECAKLEFYARIARPYEKKKCAQNGEVYKGDSP